METSLYIRIQQDILNSLKNKSEGNNSLRLSTLRIIMSELKNFQINSLNREKVPSDEEVINILKKSVKTHEDSISQYKSAARNDLVETEEAELKIIKEYLPESITSEEVKSIVEIILNSKSDLNFGQLMKETLAEVSKTGKLVDGKMVSEIVKSSLA